MRRRRESGSGDVRRGEKWIQRTLGDNNEKYKVREDETRAMMIPQAIANCYRIWARDLPT
jgi:hypothetical protein